MGTNSVVSSKRMVWLTLSDEYGSFGSAYGAPLSVECDLSLFKSDLSLFKSGLSLVKPPLFYILAYLGSSQLIP